MLNLLVIFGFITAFFVFYILITLVFKDKASLQRRLKSINKTKNEIVTRKEKKVRERGKFLSIPQKRLEKLEGELYAANIKLRAQEFITMWFVSTILLPVLVIFFGGSIIAACAILIILAFGPIAAVKLIKRKRLSQLDEQLVDALQIMCSALRAGFSFQKTLENIAEEMPDPISREFGRVAKECNLGMPMETSFNRLIQRTNSKDIEMICSAVLIQRQIGGNLSEILSNVSDTIRQRIKIKGDIKVLTASGVISGYIIGLLPVFILLLLMILNPEYMEFFFTESLGRIMLAAAVVLEIIGFLFVKKVVNIKL